MGLPNILTPPGGESGWSEYWFQHFQDHLEILEAIQKQYNVKLTEYLIDPWLDSDKEGILERHQQYHSDMNAALKLAGNDLSDVDFKKGNELKAWIYLNYFEHSNARQTLGI